MKLRENHPFAGFCRLALLVLTASPCFPQNWIQLTPTGTPPVPRGFHGVTGVYDPGSDSMIVFAGRDVNGNNLNDTWVLTNANDLGGTGQWINLIADGASGSPPPRSGHSAVYDTSTNRMIIFGGCNGYCLPTLNDVWVLTNANGLGGTPSWVQLSPVGSAPAGRTRHAAAYDQTNNRMIVFAGQDGGGFGCSTFFDVWVLSNANGLGGTPTWTQLSPSGGPPAGQYAPSGVYDPSSNAFTVFGGAGIVNGVCQNSNASWFLTNANGLGGAPVWTNLTAEGAAGSPPARGFHTAVYNASSNMMTIFAGAGPSGDLADVWTLSNANGMGATSVWASVSTTGGPPPARDSHTAVLDSSTNRMTIFGGDGSGVFFNDAWVLTAGPRYSVCLLYDPTKAVKAGSTVPIKLQLCDANGNDLSSASIVVHAVSVIQTSTSISGAVENSGNSNPDSDFRFDATLGSTGGYIFNLKTTGLAMGTYNVNFTVTGDSFVYAAAFQVM